MKELTAIQTELKAPKSQYNKFGKFNYRKAEDILEALKPLLKEHGCTVVCTDDIVEIGDRIYVKATASIKNSSNETETSVGFARESESIKGMEAAQITGAASSYARKYALNGLFAIDDNQDADTTSEGKDGDATDIAKAMAELAKSKTLQDLQTIAKTYSHLMGNKSFLSACTAKRKELGL